MTDKGIAPHGAIPVPVTCAKCGTDIPPEHNMLVLDVKRYDWSKSWCKPGKPICVPCINGLEWPYTGIVPWRTLGARRAGRHRDEYQHRCARCGRGFYGAIDRRYCSDACGEATRNARRDRTRDRDARPCDTCGDTFTPPRTDGRYCSPACRQKAYRRRQTTSGGAS